MTPFHFGSSKAPLYGVYHAPTARKASAPAVLICPALGEEGNRSHRMLRILADRLAEQGSPVLRFDYPGTGESAGACEEVSLKSMASAIEEAHVELEDMSGHSKIVWLALRAGTIPAATAAPRVKPRGLILWEAVSSGTEYLNEVSAAHSRAVRSMLDKVVETETESLGFMMPDTLRKEIAGFSAPGLTRKLAREVVLISRDNDTRLADAAEQTGAKVTVYADPTEKNWNSDEAMNAYLVPTPTLDVICDQVAAW